MTLNIYPPEHMKHSCGSYVNKRPFCLSYFSSFFSFVGFFEQWTPIYIHFFFSCRVQCCPFEFPSLAVILKHSRRFINFIPLLMAGSLPSFMPALMTWAFKKESLCVSNTNSFFPPKKNTLSLFPFFHHFLLFKHSHPFTPIKPSYYGAGEKPRLLLP